ncbi:class I SAM-dependent methyltransferase [Novosphingobium sp. ERN07]|uniref:class I SAM-dependent methyltransferase n=1 Tax=Novosphingobium sp. ERN07 TaxID=2726187 RepID=UPI001456C0BF|nr:class I SAM-dependent methyltransferase [Novosphingobium sp. ERN07]NLR73377.1 class I SAM-dependent methyltransferase [Novosphingobium sp. ERN07]
MEGYAITAQYYDPLAAATHADVDRQIAAALEGLDTALGPIVDIGAGTGLTTALIARTLAAAEILAIEPDPAMRSALMTRIWSDPDLRERVTILPFGALSAPLPEQIAGAVLSAALVHFAPADREMLWALFAERLAQTGRIVVEVQCPTADDMPDTQMASVQVGRINYQASASAQRIGPDRQRWHMSYRAGIGERELRCDQTTYECWVVSADTIVAEAARAGLTGRITNDLVVLTRA